MPRKMRRGPRDGPKVWHNPDVLVPRRHPITKRPASEAPPAPAAVDETPAPPPTSSRRQVARIASAAAPDPLQLERERLLERLRVAEGRTAITRAADELKKAGFELDADDQDCFIQLLEHADEAIVQGAIGDLARILTHKPPRRLAMLESRLRRLEAFADDPATQAAAARLRRQAAGRDA